MDENERYQRAKEQVKGFKDFYSHLLIFVIVNIGLFLINITTSPDVYWFYWPLIGWGIGITCHAMSVFGIGGILGKNWEERKIQEIMKKEEKK
ncbi:MAG: 2TM domain-containing protein [Atribacterota bacterium]